MNGPGEENHTDVLIVGAGLSGIGMAAHLQDEVPDLSYVILEARSATGGTWDLFRYPGIRSDSDMFTMGYRFKPWTHPQSVAPGGLILDYIREAAAERGIDANIRLEHRVTSSAWDSVAARWTITADTPDGPVEFTCRFLIVAAGYYAYDGGYTPEFPGRDDFTGEIIHPQAWPADLDWSGKRVAVIGSGATAVTLVPALAELAAHVTMVQRSPTYMFSAPSVDKVSQRLRERLPEKFVYRLGRWRNIAVQMAGYQLARRRPGPAKKFLVEQVAKELPPDCDIAHFTPTYDPWDERLCLVTDGDLFAAIRSHRVDVVTGTIDAFTPDGIRMSDGREVAADIIVTATGFNLAVRGGMDATVDGRQVVPAETMVYRGMMLADVPNMAFIVGYTNAAWTLKADLVADFVCRVLRHMRRHRYDTCVPVNDDPDIHRRSMMLLSAGYIRRAADRIPMEGSRRPWRLRQNVVLDFLDLRWGRLADGALRFRRASRPPAPLTRRAATKAR